MYADTYTYVMHAWMYVFFTFAEVELNYQIVETCLKMRVGNSFGLYVSMYTYTYICIYTYTHHTYIHVCRYTYT